MLHLKWCSMSLSFCYIRDGVAIHWCFCQQACNRRRQRRPRCRHLANSTKHNVVGRPTGAATWRTRRNITSCLILTHWPHHRKTWRHLQNRKYITYCIIVRKRPSHCYRCKKFREIWTCSFWDMRAHRHTDRHTCMLITIFGPPAGGVVMNACESFGHSSQQVKSPASQAVFAAVPAAHWRSQCLLVFVDFL